MFAYRFNILLYSIDRFAGERSISGLYHLLKGKKSSQTIQDGQLFKLSFLFRTMPRYSRTQFDKDIHYLVENEYVLESQRFEGHLFVTNKGTNKLETFINSDFFPHGLDGWEYEQMAGMFWKRLSLITQTISYLTVDQSNFIPVTRNEEVFRWVKRWLQRTGLSKRELANALHSELKSLFQLLPPKQAAILSLRLSGHHRYGLTFSQIGSHVHMEEEGARFLFQAALHQSIAYIQSKREESKYLHTMIADLQNKITLTASTRKTYQYYKQGLSFSEIANVRNLKASTIEDHFIEIALNDANFSIRPFVSKELENKVISLYYTLQTKRMKPIKEACNEDVSYFQIRLVIAKGEKR